jgi:hypothetical protein
MLRRAHHGGVREDFAMLRPGHIRIPKEQPGESSKTEAHTILFEGLAWADIRHPGASAWTTGKKVQGSLYKDQAIGYNPG